MSAVTEVGDGYRWRVHGHVPKAGAALMLIQEAGVPIDVSVRFCIRNGSQTAASKEARSDGRVPSVIGVVRPERRGVQVQEQLDHLR